MTSIPAEAERAWADVHLGALVANARTVAAASGARLLPMVKANAYGVGVLPVVRALEPLGPWGFGVATLEEGAQLRAAGVTRPLVVFTPLQPSLIPLYHRHDLRPAIGDRNALAAWLGQGDRPFHLEIDTGMARAGFRPDEVAASRSLLEASQGWEGAFTHFHSADCEPDSVAHQWAIFQQVLGTLPRRPSLVHAANSAAALRGTAFAADLVRPGIFLYGGDVPGVTAEPVVRLQARVVALRTLRAGESVSYGATWVAPADTRVATLSIGYADGVLRSLSGVGAVEINGEVAPLLGRVTMDFIMVAVQERCALGDVATIIGGLVSLDDQARRAGTISYELLTAMGPRIARRYA
jgi:alanine racemase